MLVFINFGGGRYWWLGPLAGIAFSLISSVLSEWLTEKWRRAEYLSASEEFAEDIGWFDLIDFVLLIVLVAMIVKAAMMVRDRGGLRAMLRTAQQREHGGQHWGARGPQGGGAPARRPDFDRVVAALQKLPTEVVSTRAELEQLPGSELRRRLERLGAECKGAVEKPELVSRLLATTGAGGAGGESCAICAEEYSPGDVVRVLPCGNGRHAFHLECIDRWFLKSTEHSAPKGCPLCNDTRWLSGG